MMNYICHRVNKVADLRNIPVECGAEIDLRDDLGGHIYLEHDPFVQGESFEEWLKSYEHGTLILNIKSERIEDRVLDLIKKANVRDFFFLDSSFPMIYTLSKNGISSVALRFSEFEGLDTAQMMSGRVDWIWADCFTKIALTEQCFVKLKSLGYKICVVSPELQGRPDDLRSHAEYFKNNNILPDAICTKSYNVSVWKEYFE